MHGQQPRALTTPIQPHEWGAIARYGHLSPTHFITEDGW